MATTGATTTIDIARRVAQDIQAVRDRLEYALLPSPQKDLFQAQQWLDALLALRGYDERAPPLSLDEFLVLMRDKAGLETRKILSTVVRRSPAQQALGIHAGPPALAVYWLSDNSIATFMDVVETFALLRSTVKVKKSAIGLFVIIPHRKQLSPQSNAYLRRMRSAGVNIEVFEELNLLYNPVMHSIVPSHSRMTEAQASSWLQRLRTTPDQQARLKKDDAVAQWHGFQVGDMVKIKRPEPTAGYAFESRIVG